MYYLTQFLGVRNLKAAKQGGSGLGSFRRLQCRHWPELQSSESLTGTGGRISSPGGPCPKTI